MDGAYMFVITTKDGTNYVIDEYIGVGHGHKTVKEKQVKSFAFSKDNDIVTVEFSIPNKLNNVELKGKISGIWAISRDYKFGYHSKRGKLELEF
jgi:c-di-GMP-binding flagellar brake protein YcgR